MSKNDIKGRSPIERFSEAAISIILFKDPGKVALPINLSEKEQVIDYLHSVTRFPSVGFRAECERLLKEGMLEIRGIKAVLLKD